MGSKLAVSKTAATGWRAGWPGHLGGDFGWHSGWLASWASLPKRTGCHRSAGDRNCYII